VAEDLNLPQHVLRFWETRFAQIKPMKRGGGRRYYRPDDVELLKGIRFLLYVKGFTIKGVQRILKESGNRFVMALGSGDMSGLESLELGRVDQADGEDTDGMGGSELAEADEEDVLVHPARPETPRARLGLSGLLRRDPEPRLGMPADSAQTLQDVLMELLECKRLLDQVR
jgi:DNA-binding transcriptional MerR regulator